MSLIERAPSEQESLSALSRTESSLSGSSEPAGYGGPLQDDDSDIWSSSTGDMHSIRESVLSAVGMRGAPDIHPHYRANEGGPPPISAITRQDILRRTQLRRRIDKLKENRMQREEDVERNRESLAACRENLKFLQTQRSELQYRIAELERMKDAAPRGAGDKEMRGGGGGKGGSSVAAAGLLRAQLGRVRVEIVREEEAEREVVQKLQAAELQLSETILAYSEFEERDKELRDDEKQMQTAKNLHALQRLQTQTRRRVNTDRTKRSQERVMEATLKAQETQTKEAIERARRAHEEGKVFLHKTLERRREKEAEKGRKEREELDKRMRAALSLKRNMESSEGTIQALQMLKGERDRKEKALKDEERRQAVVLGENPDEVLLRKKRDKEFAEKRAEFEDNRKSRHLEIVSKLLEERKVKERAEKLASKSHWKGRWPIGVQQPKDVVEVKQKDGGRRNGRQYGEDAGHPSFSAGDNEGVDPLISAPEDTREGDFESSDEGEVMEEKFLHYSDSFDKTLAKPEIDGLWSKKAREQQQPVVGSLQQSTAETDGGGDGEGEEVRGERRGGRERSKLEQEMMAGVMEKLKKSVVRPQIAAGREFKGCPFTSKPEVALFKDFTPGQKLKQKLTITNVSYTVNHCKLVGISPHLKDFVTVNFNPPGAISAGLTCHMTVTFEPQLNEDLSGEIELLSQTGPFSIPVKCTTRKCIVSVEEGGGMKGGEVDFGRVCIGETSRRYVTLRNDGALSTDFSVTTDGKKKLAMTSMTFGSVADKGPADSAHSVTSVLSVMSEVRGDWGGVGRVKDTDRPISRSTCDLIQFRTVGKQDDKQEKPEKPDEKPAPPDKSKPALPGKPATPKQAGKRSKRGTPDKPKPVTPDQPEKPVKPVTPLQADEDCGLPVLVEETVEELAVGHKDEHDGGPLQEGEAEGVEMDAEQLKREEREKRVDLGVDITVGRVREGVLEGYSSCQIELIFSPQTAVTSSQLFTVHFSRPGVPPITISVKGEGLDLPVDVERDSIDLKICTIDRLYQDSIEIHNRGPTALRVSFNFPPELAPHMEILPRHGLVQGSSSFSAQLKFLPCPGIFTDCAKYFDGPENDCLTVPTEVAVVDQVWPVKFTIRARVTQSDLHFSCTDIDFGNCTIHESVVTRLEITNTSILSQEFGFVHLPECVDVQPNDGFGTLLPRETISLDVSFSAGKPKEYSFELTCLTDINRTFKIACKGRGILPALKLSENVVNFSMTPLNDTTTARITISNPKLSRLSSPVIRGAILPQGPKAFEFLVPEGVPLSISPRVGTLGLDKSVSIELSYSPHLSLSAIREEALRLATETRHAQLAKAATVQPTTIEPAPVNEKKGKRGASRADSRRAKAAGSGRSSKSGERRSGEGGDGVSGDGVSGEGGDSKSSVVCSGASEEEVKVDPPEEGSEVWQQAVTNLLDGFQNRTDQFSIPCFVSSEAPKSELVSIPYRPEDTLYVEVSVPIVKPALLLISNEGRNMLDFAAVATGDSLSKLLTVKNISDQHIELSCSPLDPHGPFDMRNALRPLPPSASHTLILRFSPHHGGKYYEPFKLFYSESCGMELRLVGEAVEPHVVLEPDMGRMELGHTYVGDASVRKLELRNTCSLGVHYCVRLQGRRKKEEKKREFRAVNYSGQPAFDCIPFQGRIEPEAAVELSVSFTPDHQSSHFTDTLYIDINDSLTHTVQLSGQAWASTMYILGADTSRNLIDGDQDSKFESMAATLPMPDGQASPVRPVLVLFQSGTERWGGDGEGGEGEGGEGGEGEGGEGGEEGGDLKRELVIGCVKTALVKKGSGDFSVEPIPSSNPHAKTFSFEPTKWSVEAGSTETLTVTFHPPKAGPAHTIEANTNLTLKGDTVQVYRLLLRAIRSE